MDILSTALWIGLTVLSKQSIAEPFKQFTEETENVFWLTLNVYHEARSENLVGQMAVVHVTKNRSIKRNLSIKDVVLQPKQFSWTNIIPKKRWLPLDLKAFDDCFRSVQLAYNGYDFTEGATYYHHKSITPYWADSYTYISTFGTHHYYANYSQ